MLFDDSEPQEPLVGLTDEQVARRLVIHTLEQMVPDSMWFVLKDYCKDKGWTDILTQVEDNGNEYYLEEGTL